MKVEFEDLSRQMSELSRLPAGLRGSIGRQIALVQASAKEEAPVRRFGSGGGELREEELKQLLQRVDGVGHADVMITLKASNEKVTLKDNTQKGESNEEKTVLVENSSRDSSPYIIQEKEPEIEGIVIVCEEDTIL